MASQNQQKKANMKGYLLPHAKPSGYQVGINITRK
jgi:hypothetical protein